jgi:hypothetical protein
MNVENEIFEWAHFFHYFSMSKKLTQSTYFICPYLGRFQLSRRQRQNACLGSCQGCQKYIERAVIVQFERIWVCAPAFGCRCRPGNVWLWNASELVLVNSFYTGHLTKEVILSLLLDLDQPVLAFTNAVKYLLSRAIMLNPKLAAPVDWLKVLVKSYKPVNSYLTEKLTTLLSPGPAAWQPWLGRRAISASWVCASLSLSLSLFCTTCCVIRANTDQQLRSK